MIKTVGLLFVLCCELFSNINNQPNTLQLLDSEKELLWDKKAITICSEQKSPYIIDNTDPLEGIIIDMLKEFESILGIPFKVIRAKKQGDCQKKIDKNEVDFMTMLKINASHANEDITKWYLGDFFVITTAYDKPYIDDLSNIKHMKISVNEEFKNFINQLKVDYPTINFVLVKNTQEGLRGVIYEDFYAHIDLHKTMAWLIQHKYLGEVKVSGTLQFYNVKNVLHVSNSDDSDILLNILNKTIKQFDPQLKREIENSWISIVYEKGFDYKMLMQIMIVFIAVLFVALYFHYQLKKQVQKHIEQNKTQQALLFQQSKLASMGEMINNIAHQWRQPLNRINSSAAVIYTFGDKSIQQKVKDIENNTRYMSDTIEDFSNFFHPDKEKVEFDLDQALQKA
ncbi:MAG: hypothetical protein U9N30_09570, partial [Campylobacterota bacterium]|nr:hypothetical protein [Campylobacterota bacterium]